MADRDLPLAFGAPGPRIECAPSPFAASCDRRHTGAAAPLRCRPRRIDRDGTSWQREVGSMSPFPRATRASAIVTFCLLGALGCKSTPTKAPESTPPNPSVTRSEAPAPMMSAQVPDLRVVYFDFERWELRDDARSALKANAQELKES